MVLCDGALSSCDAGAVFEGTAVYTDGQMNHTLGKKSEYSLLVLVNYPFNRSFAQAELSPSSVDLMQMIHAYLNALNKHKGCLQQYVSVGQYRFI